MVLLLKRSKAGVPLQSLSKKIRSYFTRKAVARDTARAEQSNMIKNGHNTQANSSVLIVQSCAARPSNSFWNPADVIPQSRSLYAAPAGWIAHGGGWQGSW